MAWSWIPASENLFPFFVKDFGPLHEIKKRQINIKERYLILNMRLFCEVK